jgi:hypothetical protein
LGDSWTFEDDAGSLTIRIVKEEKNAGEEALKVSWFSAEEEHPYQSESWRESKG